MARRRQKRRDSPPVAAPPVGQSEYLVAFLIVAAGVIIYGPALNGGPIWDDGWYIRLNPLLHSWGGLAKFWFQPGAWVEYYPVHETLLWIEYQLWGESMLGYHIVSLVLHLISAFLFWRLLARLGLRLAWLGALLFTVHPVNVQSVAWACEQKNALSLPFALLAMTAWVDFEQSGRQRDYRRALGWYFVGMLSKITMAPFPFVILLFAWWKRGRIGAVDLRRAGPFLLLAISLTAISVLASILYSRNSHDQGLVFALGGPATYVARAAVLFWFYLGTGLFPVDLTPAYPLWQINGASPVAWLPLMALMALVTWAFLARRRWGRHLLLGLGFFALTIFPFLGFPAISYMVDMWVELQLLYLPLLGVIGLIVAAMQDLGDKLPASLRLAPTAALTLVAVVMLAGARAYAGWFANDEVFWTRAIHRNPSSGLAHQDLGCYLIEQHRYGEAITSLRQGIALMPAYGFGYYNLGIALEKAGRIDESQAAYRTAIVLNPIDPGSYVNLGERLRRMGRIPEAEAVFRDGLRHVPDSVKLAVNLAGLLFDRGQYGDALALYALAGHLNPDSAQLQYDYGTALMKTGNLPDAADHLASAVALDPTLGPAHENLGAILAQLGRLPEAIAELQFALAINPVLGSARDNLARALAQSGRIPEAIAQFQTELTYHPDDPQARDNLARLQQYQQQHPGGAAP